MRVILILFFAFQINEIWASKIDSVNIRIKTVEVYQGIVGVNGLTKVFGNYSKYSSFRRKSIGSIGAKVAWRKNEKSFIIEGNFATYNFSSTEFPINSRNKQIDTKERFTRIRLMLGFNFFSKKSKHLEFYSGFRIGYNYFDFEQSKRTTDFSNNIEVEGYRTHRNPVLN